MFSLLAVLISMFLLFIAAVMSWYVLKFAWSLVFKLTDYYTYTFFEDVRKIVLRIVIGFVVFVVTFYVMRLIIGTIVAVAFGIALGVMH